MTVVAYIVAVVVILALCALGMSIGLILKNKPLTSCGRASMGNPDIACPACGSKTSECRGERTSPRKTEREAAHRAG